MCVCSQANRSRATLSCDSSYYMCENKGADQLHISPAADKRLCFHNKDSTIPHLLNPKFKPLAIFSDVQPGLYGTWSENPEDRFSHDAAHTILGTLQENLSSYTYQCVQSQGLATVLKLVFTCRQVILSRHRRRDKVRI